MFAWRFRGYPACGSWLSDVQEFKEETALGAKILVPLCGKTVDIGWFLSEGHEVVGVELVPQAVAALHAGLERTPETRPWGRLVAHESPGLTILEGNVLDLEAAHLAGITHVWDRAAIVALPPVDRIRYAALLQQHLSPGTQTLLVSFFYDQAHMDGPPYSVPPAELSQLFTPCAAIEALGPGCKDRHAPDRSAGLEAAL